MKALPILLLCLALLIAACDPGTSGSGNNGGPQTDTSGATSGTDGQRPWSAEKNFFDPNRFEGIPDIFTQEYPPFSASFMRVHGIKMVERRGYRADDNPSLDAATNESGLVLGRRSRYGFDAGGNLRSIEENTYLGDTIPATTFRATWTADANGRVSEISIEEGFGNQLDSRKLSYAYGADGRLQSQVDSRGGKAHYSYAAGSGWRYVLQVPTTTNQAILWVEGGKGAFSDSACIAMAESIRDLDDPNVPYHLLRGQGGSKVSPDKVRFIEVEGRTITRETHTLRKGNGDITIDRRVRRTYLPDGNLEQHSVDWDVENANFKMLIKHKYNSKGDLEERFYQHQQFNESPANQVDRYTYDAQGIPVRHTQTERKGQAPSETILIEFFSIQR